MKTNKTIRSLIVIVTVLAMILSTGPASPSRSTGMGFT